MPTDWSFITRHLDEAMRLIELRRYRRILQAGRLPFIYAWGTLLTAWMLVPFLFASGGILAGRTPISAHAGWSAGALWVTTAIAAGLAAYLRAQHLWNQERRLKTFHTWLLTCQNPARVTTTTVAMAAFLGLALTAVPATLGLLLAIVSGVGGWQVLLSLLLIPLCALLGAALGVAAFFVSFNLAPRRLVYPAVAALALVVLGLWLRIEMVENGWHRNWDEHPGRLIHALNLVTPAPAVFGAAVPTWWHQFGPRRLGVDIQAWQWSLLYGASMLIATAYATCLAVRGYLRMGSDPTLIEDRPSALTEEAGQEYYWKGFSNPVWTRDIRTRLRSRDTAEFIFFASIAVAAGAFVPLVMTASDLSDPLQTARAARQVFFWLTMTLVALVALVAPGLTSDVITQERQQGSLEMLIGTPLRPQEILRGKLLGAVSVLALLISPSLPLFGLCYLFHGAAGDQVMKVYSLLLVTLAVAAFIGLSQSAINSRSGAAKFWAYALTGLFVSIPGGPFWLAAWAAAPDAGMRQTLSTQASAAFLIGIFLIFGLVLLWGNACEQLEYSEY
jgi:ABC-type transport system involved in multi-copper enzyme maturation permease subunit